MRAMSVNPKDPDTFLSLSTSASHAEQLDDQRDIYDQAVQTDRSIDREFVTSAKKFANFNEFSEIKKNSYTNSLNARVGVVFQWNSLLICIISNKPTTTTEEFDAFHGFMLIKI